MAKNSVADWDTTAANNTDVGGIDINENCPAANINNGMREIMAQIATLKPVGGGATQTLTAAERAQALSNIGSIWEKIGVYTLSSASLLDITDLSAFETIRIIIMVTPSISTGLALRTSVDNGTSFASGAADYFSTPDAGGATTTGTQISLTSVPMDAGAAWSIEFTLTGFNKAYAMKMMGRACGVSSVTFSYLVNAGTRQSAVARNALRIFPGSGGTITGSVYVEGVRG